MLIPPGASPRGLWPAWVSTLTVDYEGAVDLHPSPWVARCEEATEVKAMAAPINYRPVCSECRMPFLVFYLQTDPEEPLQLIPAPCPCCGEVTGVQVGRGAARAAQLEMQKPNRLPDRTSKAGSI
jgi:hypothetical protein